MKKIALLSVCLATPAFAQPKPKAAKDEPPPKTIVFEPDSVFGEIQSGDGSRVDVVKHGVPGRLTVVRKHFRPEMLKTAENL